MEDETQLDLSTPRGRVLWVLAHVYGNNQRRMARHLDISQAAVSRLVRGEQRAGPNLLKAVASNQRISKEWLETGQGEPLAASAPKALAGGRMLPVATVILPGVPSDHPHLLTGHFFPVADMYHGDMRYWLQVPADSSITSSEQWKVKQGDHLLLEADSRMWRDNAQLLDRRLCGIRLKDGAGGGCRLAEVRRNPDDGRLDYLDFAVVGTEPAGIEAASGWPVRPKVRTRRVVDTGEKPAPGEPRGPDGEWRDNHRRIQFVSRLGGPAHRCCRRGVPPLGQDDLTMHIRINHCQFKIAAASPAIVRLLPQDRAVEADPSPRPHGRCGPPPIPARKPGRGMSRREMAHQQFNPVRTAEGRER